MKILAFTIRVECTHCDGKKRMRKFPDDKNGEMIDCWWCNGLGHIEAVSPFDDVVKLVQGLARVEAEKLLQRSGR